MSNKPTEFTTIFSLFATNGVTLKTTFLPT
jgi:hypothetical protein